MSRHSIDPLLPRPAVDSVATDVSLEAYEPTAPLANMGISLSTARILAPLSFVVDFGCQVYGMTSTPNMKDIHDKNLAAFSPQPFAIAGFFSPQQVIQLLWLRELFRPDAQVERGTVRYVPWYALGNFCIAVWMIFWNKNDLKGSNVFVTINTLSQLYYLIALKDPSPRTWQSKLTNIVNITFAGIGVLDLFHNTSAGYFPGVSPNSLTKIATVVGAPLTALVSPLLFGACIAYDLFAVAIGQHQIAQKALGAALTAAGGGGGEGWAKLVGAVGLGVSAIVGARAYGGANWL